MKLIILALAFAVGLRAQQAPSPSLLPYEVGLAAASAADLASSMGLYELNPVLGRGPFGPRQALIKGGITALSITSAHRMNKKHPTAARVVLLIGIAEYSFLAGHNFAVKWNLGR